MLVMIFEMHIHFLNIYFGQNTQCGIRIHFGMGALSTSLHKQIKSLGEENNQDSCKRKTYFFLGKMKVAISLRSLVLYLGIDIVEQG